MNSPILSGQHRKSNPAAKRRARKKSQNNSPRRLATLEPLESRQMMSANLPGAEFVQPPTNDTATVIRSDWSTGDTSSRIINGTSTNGFDAVGIVNGGCTGTLISPSHVLTAAHCTEGVGDRQGSFEVNGETIRTVDITDHPQYNPNRFDVGYDISIMELSRPVAGVVPYEIYRQTPRVGQSLTLVGFGEGGNGNSGGQGDFGTKRVGTTPIDEVTNLHISWNFDNNSESNTAPGDSGGPAFVNAGGSLQIAGVTSGGSSADASIGDTSFDTRVDTFAAWIDSVTGSTTPDPDPTDDHVNEVGSGATAIPLANGIGRGEGELELAGDRDVFRFTLVETSEVTVGQSSTDGSLDTFVRLYNAQGSQIAANDDSGGTLNSQVTSELAAGTYYVSAGSYADDGEGSYVVDVSAVSANDESPFPDAIGKNLNANGRLVVRDRLTSGSDTDAFEITANRTGRWRVSAAARTANLDTIITVYDSQGEEVAYNDDWRGTNSRAYLRVRAGETYYVEVSSWGNTRGAYRLQVVTQNSNRSSGSESGTRTPRQDSMDRYSVMDQVFAETSWY